MKPVVIVFTFVLFLSCVVVGQDPTKVAPESYKLQFENEFIRVLRVTYAPRAKVVVHDHSRYPAGYVYLSDSDPIRFTHTDWEHPVLTRPKTRAGSFRLSPTRFDNETHEVENTGDLTSEFLRIEVMTEAPDRQSLNGRFKPYEGKRDAGLDKKEFENSQLRVTRIISTPGKGLIASAPPREPSLIVVLAGPREIPKGQTYWLEPGESKKFGQSAQFELLRFDFKTKPRKL